jgi:hypothetical protein
MDDFMTFNGIDGASGGYLLPPLPPSQIAAVARGEPVDPKEAKELQGWYQFISQGHFGVREGVDPGDLSQAGWGVIFPAGAEGGRVEALREALKELLSLRQEQAAGQFEHYFKVYSGPDGYRAGESKQDWLTRQGVGPGPANPDKVPYYLLLVGAGRLCPLRPQRGGGREYRLAEAGRLLWGGQPGRQSYQPERRAADPASGGFSKGKTSGLDDRLAAPRAGDQE